MSYPKSLQDLIEYFSSLPGIGNKTAERLAFYTLNMSEEKIEGFADALKGVKEKIKYCEKCGHISESSLCDICSDESRDQNVLCVVENIKDVIAFEKMNIFDGRYHVLGGAISPINGILPDDLNISRLVERIQNEEITEIILGTNPTIEGETTANYLVRLLDDQEIVFTKIAQGLPMGSDIEYADEITLSRAFEGRRPF